MSAKPEAFDHVPCAGSLSQDECCVHELIEHRARQRAEAEAVVSESERVSYAELNARANRLAHRLRSLGVGPEDRVGICLERNVGMIVSILGVLKAGGCYVPLDPTHPQERLSWMLRDCGATVLITQGELRERFAGCGVRVLELAADGSGRIEGPGGRCSAQNLSRDETGVRPGNLAYVIYTSGSTGQPKGVMVEHRNVASFLSSCISEQRVTPEDRSSQFASFGFDMSVHDIFCPLAAGATLVQLPAQMKVPDEKFVAYLAAHRVSLCVLPTAFWHHWAAQIGADRPALSPPPTLRRILLGGEKAELAYFQRWLGCETARHCTLRNGYGPTETTVYVTSVAYGSDSSLPQYEVPIGRPVANTRIYILDEQGEPVPVGVTGELYVAGAQVARGYLNRPELTAERFLPDRFGESAGARMYRTGDLGRWLADGTIEYQGRDDGQVKIRGFRIELGEIEARLLEYPGIRQAVVVAREDEGTKRLVAYYTRTGAGEAFEATSLREYVQARLPEYMVPAAYVWLQSLPLTPNGKVDRRALPEPTGDSFAARAYEAPLGELEQTIAQVWSEILKVDSIGRGDNFFQLGGHSLLLVGVIERLRHRGISVDPGSFYVQPTLAGLAGTAHRTQHGAGESPPDSPPGIPAGCEQVTPAMLPLANLPAAQIAQVVHTIPGGANSIQDIYPLSPLQEGMLYHHLTSSDGDPYVTSTLTRFSSRERLDAYIDALQQVTQRHDILRTTFFWEGLDRAVQIVLREARVPVEVIACDGTDTPVADQLIALHDWRRYKFDLRRSPPHHLYVAHDERAGCWWLLSLVHHLVADARSMELLREEIDAILAGREDELPRPVPFRNFIASTVSAAANADHETCFRAMLADVTEGTAPFGLHQMRNGECLLTAHERLDEALCHRIRTRARTLGVSAAALFHAAWALVAAKATGRRDVVFGTVLLGRLQAGVEADRAIGLFLNTLPLRVALGERSVEQVVRQVSNSLAELIRHEHAPLTLAQRCSGVTFPQPLFTSLFNYRHASRPLGVEARSIEGRTHYPLSVSVDDDGIRFELTADAPAATGPRRICAILRTALYSIVASLEARPDEPMVRLGVLDEAERHQVLHGWAGAELPHDRERCLHELIEEQASNRAAAEAVVSESERVSYAELNARANRMAHRLRSLGVGPEIPVGICLERNVGMIVSILGVLKAGGFYVPLDPTHPQERLSWVLQDCGARVLITQGALSERFTRCAAAVVEVSADGSGFIEGPDGPGSAQNLSRDETGVRPENLAYVIYTSGSTGQPKGVMVEHRNVASFLNSCIAEQQVTTEDRISQLASFGFDMSIHDIFCPLAAGATLVQLPKEMKVPDEAFVAYLAAHRVSQCVLPTAFWQHWAAQIGADHPDLLPPPTLNRVVFGGEKLELAHFQRWVGSEAARHCTLQHIYGPTETTVYVTSIAYDPDSPLPQREVPIGRPIANSRVYILDEQGEPVPVGVTGELYVGGAQVARGYLNRPELTAERFLPDRFCGPPGARMYRTGDLGRWLPDGTIEYQGRNDGQVKIRGFRIELGEIEARLLAHPGIREAVVVVREEEGTKRLVAYYTRTGDGEALEVMSLREHVQTALPEYMVPAAYVWLQSLPLTLNGKVDRRALPEPSGPSYAARVYEAPQGELEETIARVWSEALKVEPIGRSDNFFQLGGHSLLVVRVVARLRQLLDCNIPYDALFTRPVLQDFATAVASVRGAQQGVIPLAARDRPLPLSFAQERLWVLVQAEKSASGAYHVPMALRLHGAIDADALERALNALVRRHEALRTTFFQADGVPMQRITPADRTRVALRRADFRGNTADWTAALNREFATAFDLEAGPLFRCWLAHVGELEYVLLVTMHHIVTDGWSLGVIGNELAALYGAELLNAADPLTQLPVQYADYACWQRTELSDERLGALRDYWRSALAGAPDHLAIPLDRPRTQTQSHRGSMERFALDAGLLQGLNHLSQRHGVTLYTTVLTAWALLMSRLAAQEDVVIGTPAAGRNQNETLGTVGFFVDTWPIRVHCDGRQSFAELLRDVSSRVQAARAHGELPFQKIVEAVNPPRNPACHPLFQVMFSWEDFRTELPDFAGVRAEHLDAIDSSTAQFDLTLDLTVGVQDIQGAIEYSTALFERATVVRWIGCFRRLLAGIAANESCPVARLSLLDEADRHQVLHGWGGAELSYGRQRCVHELIEEQARERGAAEALVSQSERLSYAELNARANRLARRLRSLGVGPEVRVAICLERSVGMIVSILGVLKAGGCYVPLDPAYPRERLSWVLHDCGAKVLITQRELRERFAGCEACVLESAADGSGRIEDLGVPDGAPDLSRDGTGVGPENLAYVIYTSGSTGRPKGVMVEHRNALNVIRQYEEQTRLAPGDRMLQFASVGFDVSVVEIFATFSAGATLVLRPAQMLAPDEGFVAFLEAQRVTVCDLPTAFWQQWVADLPRSTNLAPPSGLRLLVAGGEKMELRFLRAWLTEPVSRHCHVVNAYGPTETTVQVSAIEYGSDSPLPQYEVPIGRPVANTRIYILDEQGEPVPVGVTGELYVAGAQVARGYLNRPELTAERFLPDRFGESAGARMYRTGDLGRWLADGTIEYQGRNDGQVKIRGFRIELGEIEARLLEYPGIRETVVVAREDEGTKRLVAYYTRTGAGEAFEAMSLREHVQAGLPEYMVPAAYVWLQSLPVTPNGKVDRRALPEPTGHFYAARAYEAPQGELEETIARVWSEALKVEPIGRSDNFFQLGGHSLLVVRVVARLRQLLDCNIPYDALFTRPVLQDFATTVASVRGARQGVIPLAARDRPLPLSFAQERLWVLVQAEKSASGAYHVPMALRLHGAIDADALERALNALVRRHEALRTTFFQADGVPMQRITPADRTRVALRRADFRENTADWTAALNREFATAFDLEAGPLFRCWLAHVGELEYVLLVTMHHIVTDGWSLGVIGNELAALYEAELLQAADPLPPLAVQYADYACWQRAELSGERLEALRDYWRDALAGAPDQLAIPLDHPRTQIQSYQGRIERFALTADLLDGLNRLSQRHGVTFYTTLLAAWALLMSRLAAQEDVVIGTPEAGRNQNETLGIVGFFVDTWPIRLHCDGRQSFAELLRDVSSRVQAARAHGELPFQKIVEAVNPPRNAACHPVFQVAFSLENFNAELPGLAGVRAEHLDAIDLATAQFDLGLSLVVGAQEVQGAVEYSTALFDRGTILRWIGCFRRLLAGIVADETCPVARLSLLDEADRHQVLRGWGGAALSYDRQRCVHELIEEQARERAEADAVVSESGRVTYAELNARANRLARQLRSLGVGPEARVGICLERGVGMIVSILGVLKAGGCYVPLDPAHPQERLGWVLQDCGASVLITQPGLLETLESRDASVVELAADGSGHIEGLSGQSGTQNLSRDETGVGPENLAYVIYTSGSTGRPKGVMIEHRQVTALIRAYRTTMAIGARDRFLQFASFGFDASVGEIFTTLAAGATLVLRPAQMLAPDESFVSFLDTHRVTVCDLPTAFWQQWVSQLGTAGAALCPPTCVSRIAVGGEKLDIRYLRSWLTHSGARRCRIVNTYGPTEATVQVSAIEYRSDSPLPQHEVPIGRPTANMRIYILDEQGEPVPVGVTGELYIAGAQVARGYLNRAELTAERFLPDRFGGPTGARMYRTGDLGRWLADGTIEYQGRNDGQVKIRGFRVELGEIEARLLGYPGIREAVVVVREEDETKRLVAYYTRMGAGEALEAMSLREHVQSALPEYMVPAAFVWLRSLPLSVNGKVDRRALPEPSGDSYAARAYEAPQGELEETIARVWSETLKVAPIGRSDNFFQLGGHSLLVVQVVNRLRGSHPALAPIDLFRHQTLAAFAARVLAIGSGTEVGRAISLRPGDDRRALFLVHDGAGDLTYAPVLAAELDVASAIYALPSPSDPLAIPRDIPSIAAQRLRMIRNAQPSGPYRLVGHCFGGVIAYEIARQLLVAGEEVLFLGMLDSAHPSVVPPSFPVQSLESVDATNLLRQVEDHFGEQSDQAVAMRKLVAGGGDLPDVVHRARQLDLLPPRYESADLAEIHRDIGVRIAYQKAWLTYRPEPIALHVRLYVASEERHTAQDLGWSVSLDERHLHIETVGGDHFSMLRAPHVTNLGGRLRHAMAAGTVT